MATPDIRKLRYVAIGELLGEHKLADWLAGDFVMTEGELRFLLVAVGESDLAA